MTCTTRCQPSNTSTTVASSSSFVRFPREDSKCYFYPRFFELQNYLAGKLDSNSNETQSPIQATSWPSFNKSAVFQGKNIIAALSSLPSFDDWPNDNKIMTGIYFAKGFFIRTSIIGSTISIPIAKGFQKRQLVKVPIYHTDKLTPQFFISTTREIVSEDMLTEDQKRSSRVSGSELSLLEGSLKWMRENNKPPYDTPPCVDLEAVYNAMTFLGLRYEFTNFVRVPSPYVSFWKLARLPIEIQLHILESFSRPKDADLALSFPFPHLASHHFRTISSHFKEWLFDLCSRENMRYVCTQYLGQGTGVEIYRLQSQYNLYPDFSVTSTSSLPPLEPFVPNLDIVQSKLTVAIERYFWYNVLRWEDYFIQQSSEADGQPSGSNGPASAPNPQSDYPTQNNIPMSNRDPCNPSHTEARASTLTSIDMRCLLIPLEGQYLRKAERQRSETGVSITNQRKTVVVYSAVLFLEEEFSRIKEDFECFVRPRLLQLHNIYTPALHRFPSGVERLSREELCHWKSLANQVLDIFVPQLRERIFWESCADIRLLFDMAHREEFFQESCADIRFSFDPV